MHVFNKKDLEQFDKDSLKSYKKLKLIKPKAFKEYLKQNDLKSREAVIRCTILDKIDFDDLDDYKEALMVQTNPDEEKCRYYEIWEPEDKSLLFLRVVGYIAVSENQFIRVYEHYAVFLLILFSLGLLGLYLAIRFLGGTPAEPDSKDPLKIDDSQVGWNGEQPNVNGEVPEQENIEIPGFYRFTATAESGNVPLYNPPENTVYFQYDIYNILNSTEVATFNSATEAQGYIDEHQPDYSILKDNGYSIIDDSGNILNTVKSYKSVPSGDTFTVLEEELSILYSTDMVSPGNQILWNACNFLQTGEYKLKFIIHTYDVETGGECYGAVQTVEAIIK